MKLRTSDSPTETSLNTTKRKKVVSKRSQVVPSNYHLEEKSYAPMVVIGGDVRVTPAAVSHGSLTVKVNEDTNTTPGQTLFDDAGNITQQTAANTENDTDIQAGAETASAFVFDAGTSLADVVDAINAIGTTSADLVAILEALRAAGALRAQMIII